MKKITILTSYFGKFNVYFPLWMKAIEANSTIDFKLLTDNDVKETPSNLEVIKMDFYTMQKKIKGFFDFDVVVDTGYKMSEYQTLFALIFPELIEKSDFWGYCEMDLILGNLRNFFRDDILDRFDKIYYLGHLTLYKNCYELNSVALLNHEYPTATYKQAFSTSYNYHFIEHAMRYIPKYAGFKCYEEIEFGDISFKYFNFTLGRGKNCNAPQIFSWEDGCIYRYFIKDNNILKEECSYVHLQKRKMSLNVDSSEEKYLIVPNKFIPFQEVDKSIIMEYSKDTPEWRKWYKEFYKNYYLQTIKQGGLKIKFDKMYRIFRYSKKVKK